MSHPAITLKPGKEKSIRNFHPWIFSGAIGKINGKPDDGQVVEVFDHKGDYLATGHYNNGSIAVRLFDFSRREADYALWLDKIQKAYALRVSLGLAGSTHTDVYRLVHGEGDGLPGLIIDIYKDIAVIQTHSLGMHGIKTHLAQALREVYGTALTAIYDKSADTMPNIPGLDKQNVWLYGEAAGPVTVTENGKKFLINVVEGQKTGYFIDQRDNRKLLGGYSQGRRVLNTFCYSGGFSIYALQEGASEVHSVDSSKKAIELTDRNVELSGRQDRHQSHVADTFEFLKSMGGDYDIIVLDPPAFAKHLSALKNATYGYQRLNHMAFSKIRPGGILFTFSCSQVVDKDLFRKVVFAAAAQAGRNVRILHQLTQPADHPVSIYHPEGEYLKGLVLYVE